MSRLSSAEDMIWEMDRANARARRKAAVLIFCVCVFFAATITAAVALR